LDSRGQEANLHCFVPEFTAILNSTPSNGWRCAALPVQATDVRMRRGRAGAELRHRAPTGTWRRA